MPTRRRQLLLSLGVGGAAATAGCLNRLPWVGGSDDGEDDSENASTNESEPDLNPEENASGSENQTTGDEREQSPGNETENESDPETENETSTENENESEPEPVEDSTRPESVEIDDAVEADINFDLQEGTGVGVWGTIENVTADPIDLVSVTVRLYDGGGTTIFKKTDGKPGLASWSSWEFEIVTHDAEIANQCESYDVEVVAEQLD